MSEPDLRRDLLTQFYDDRHAAHEILFKHRRKNKTPAFHREIITGLHSDERQVLFLCFRGSGKSTLAEEAFIIRGGFREFRNGLIVGSTADRARQRLHAIRYEIENNEALTQLFGDLRGEMWGADQIMLSNGAMIQALGRGQSLRGIKHLDQRPDFLLVDDLEEPKEMLTPKGREEVWAWFSRDLIPALDPDYRVRVAATPLHPESTPMRLSETEGWETHTYPIYYLGENGEKVPTWPDRFGLREIGWYENLYKKDPQGFNQEYLCRSEAPESKAFKSDMIHVEPRTHRWEAAYCMFDPARTIGLQSATTGFACWSWIGPRLIVWDAWAKRMMPDEIVSSLFEVNDRWRPITIGFEGVGLNEWAMQPIRTEQTRRGIILPIQDMKAPKGKIDFIRGLQLYFAAREVKFAQELPDLKTQLLGFPSGAIDAPNALAYALLMRPGAPIIDQFDDAKHVGEGMEPSAYRQVHLVMHASPSITCAALCQLLDGRIRVYADWMREGDAASQTKEIMDEARLYLGGSFRVITPPMHYRPNLNVGLNQAIRRAGGDPVGGGPLPQGRVKLGELMRREIKGVEGFLVSSEATWTLNALAGGYCRIVDRQGLLSDHAVDGPYRLIMEALETFAGRLQPDRDEEDDEEAAPHYAFTPGGARYRTALPRR